MKQWYVLKTAMGKEQKALMLLEERIEKNLWQTCCIPQKLKVFRSGGVLRVVKDTMFPGYVFVKTDAPMKLERIVQRAREFPQAIVFETGDGRTVRRDWMEEEAFEWGLLPVEEPDLHFLRSVCGPDLKQPMGITEIRVDEERRITRAEGILGSYLDKVVKLNLHKRFAVVEVPLFQRKQPILFGIRLEQDREGKAV